jgi:DNA polymerase-3 subunit alpha
MSLDGTGDAAGVSDFAHLHLHTQYSLLDGAIRTKDLCERVRERGMKSVAVTDHGNMFGALQFYQEAKKVGVKPIFGCEAYLSEGEAAAKTDRKNYHIVLLAKNETGFKNLQRLVSFGHLRGFYYNPRVDRQMLRENSEGIVALSACLGGHISRLITAGDMDAAREKVLEYKNIFEPGSYFLELQPNLMEAQERVNAALAQLGRDLDVPLVATNDCHYVDRGQAHAHEVLMCMGMGRTFDDPNRLRHECDEFFIKRPDEMTGYFSRYPEAMANACRIAQMCNVELELGKPELPDFELPPDVHEDLEGYLRRVAHDGLTQRLAQLRARGKTPNEGAYRARLDHELSIIIEMKFPGYFLIVWDFIRHAKVQGIPVGPGRGSGAGSLVAYSLRITDLDPLEYDLLFERFLNPERVSMPDFDIDFCMDRREEVITYVSDRYGADKVGQIATFHSLKARGLVRDVCRVMNRPVSEANELAKLVPEGPKVSLSMCMAEPAALKKQAKKQPEKAGKLAGAIAIAEAASKLRQRAKDDPRVGEVLRIGTQLEGLNRHAGMHAAGIVIGNRPLWDHVPCFSADDRIVTQYTMTDVELAGLVKFDFLGLKTLTVIATAVRLVNALPDNHRHDDGAAVDIETIPLDAPGVFEMISRGDTTGVFQLESSGFKELLTKLKPDCFEDIIAAVALYRPGPLEGGMVQQFIECKHGRQAIEYPHPLLEPVLEETYGVFVYQEQVMQAAQVLAGFSLGAADLMRRAMGKKKAAEMERQRALFVEGCASATGIDAAKANEIFDLIDKFAGYGFNKSHSAAYGLITYQTAWLKHFYPVAFMAALMTCDKDKSENVVKFIAEARSMGIPVLGPDVNESISDFSVVARADESEAIRFGLGGVRNVGGNAVRALVRERDRDDGDGSYTSLFELCRRVDLRRVNKRTLEGLICAGALDGIEAQHNRAELLGALESAVDQGQSAQRDRESGQTSLFAVLAQPAAMFVEQYPESPGWTPKETLRREREALGFYLTGHPIDRYQQDVTQHATARIADLHKSMTGTQVTIGGIVCEPREVHTRAGKLMGFFQLEDQLGRVEAVVFPKSYARIHDEETGQRFGEWLFSHTDDPVFVTGKLEGDTDDDGNVVKYKILVENVRPIAEVRQERTKAVEVDLHIEQLTPERLLALKHLVADHSGPYEMRMRVTATGRFEGAVVFGDTFGVTADDDLLYALERLFEGPVARLV